jgi:hypothetical protein
LAHRRVGITNYELRNYGDTPVNSLFSPADRGDRRFDIASRLRRQAIAANDAIGRWRAAAAPLTAARN